ncbi:uncharacterized protein TRUGW13939_05544 [Talaromyces rugulosus]|uniref:Rhodopsin domain-containing protein n=1 Tax=Talaromyces rugulosus TaxID=121627 RepID=A0A7H8QWF9_TALRU|nr:uncharacterized protein TRUGW13939_05544 [Talaromyces rugulosus]QKX58422.1 hypothetical protein TRUGW13939_05544 [Talaromyces rugulosus]
MGSRAATQVGVTAALALASLIVIGTRLVYRGMKRLIDLSDILIAIALISASVQNAINIDVAAQWGAGHHKADLSEHILKSHTPAILLYLNQVFFKLTSLTSKLSLIVVYNRLFNPPISPLVFWTRNINLANGFVIATFYFSIFLVSIFQCHPISKSWDKKRPGSCVNLDNVRYASAYINIITSALLVATPLPVLFRIKHKRRQITELTVLVMLGCVHTGCAVFRVVLMYYPEPGTDVNESPLLTIAQVEINVALIACSLVVMQPIVDKIYCCLPFLDISTRSRWRIRSGRRQTTDEQNSDTLIYGNRSNGAGTSHQIWSAAGPRSAERKPGGLRSQGYGDDIIDDSDYDDEDHDTAAGGGGDSDGIEMDSNHTSKINVTTEIKMHNRNRSSLDD